MQYGFYSDNQIPKFTNDHSGVNSHGYRCAEWVPLPKGKKNTVVLGCSHTFGEGLEANETWSSIVANESTSDNLRWWNIAQPGASPNLMTRILYASEKVLFPKVIVCCWPAWSRREVYEEQAVNITGAHDTLKHNKEIHDMNNLSHNVFMVEKFAEHVGAKTFHCFAEEVYDINMPANTMKENSLADCWPIYDKHFEKITDIVQTPDLASDGKHYGVKHHERFAELFLRKYDTKLR